MRMLQILNPLKGKSPKIRTKLKQSSKKKTIPSKKSKESKKFISSLSPLSSGRLCREIQKGVDEALMKLPPPLQSQIDQMMKTLDKSSFNLQDLRTLGYRILKQATEVSEAIKASPMLTNSVNSFMSKRKSRSNKLGKSPSKNRKKAPL